MNAREAPERGHWITVSLFGSACTSWQALAWFAPLGIATVMLTIPSDGGRAVSNPIWWSIALAGQALLTVIVLVLSRAVRTLAGGWVRVVILAVGGAARGAFIALAVASAGLSTAGSVNPGLRSVNSAIVSVLALGAIGLLLQGTRDYRESYRLLLDQAVAVRRHALAVSGEIDREVVAHWETARSTILATTAQARARLDAAEVPPEDLIATAAVIADAAASRIRPMSHGLWFATGDEPPRLRLGALIRASLRPWRLPMGDIMGILGVISVIGSVLRAGPLIGLGYSALSLLLVWALLALSQRLATIRPTVPIGAVTLIVMPVMVFSATVAFGQGLMHLPPDLTGAAFGALTSSIVVAGVLVLRRMHLERRLLLDGLVAQIDGELIDLRARREQIDVQNAALGEFLHHSVQSELASVALQLGQAATAGTDTDRRNEAAAVRARLARLDALTPPWAPTTSPYDHITEVAESWRGMADVRVDLPQESAATGEQWRLAALAVEEAVANAVRSGRARRIRIDGRMESGDLLLAIGDDGQGVAGATPGLGSAWLDRHLPGAWSREQGVEGTVLTLRIVR